MNKLVDKPATADRLLRIDEVLALTNIGRSSWWAGVKSGKFPKPVKLGERTTRWRLNDIL
jgi:predicted DNA-binding transcriptional regulator AlpA